MFQVIPCVDIQQARAVRLFEGDPEKETVYFEKPFEAAKHWVDLGADYLHLVDLDAALSKGDNKDIIADIAKNLPCKVEVGGGVRSVDDAKTLLKFIDRVVIGTAAINNPDMIDELLKDYAPEKMVVSIDARDGLVAVKGWKEITDMKATDLAKRCEAQGLTHIIYTDISRDGTLQGVDADPVKAMRDNFSHTLIAGGGVATDADIDLYEDLGLQGAIVGRALYEGTISYPRATRG